MKFKWKLPEISTLLVGIGALSVGVSKVFQYDLISKIPIINGYPTIVYGIIAVASGYILYDLFKK